MITFCFYTASWPFWNNVCSIILQNYLVPQFSFPVRWFLNGQKLAKHLVMYWLTQKYNQTLLVKCQSPVTDYRTSSVETELVFQPRDLCPFSFQSPTGRPGDSLRMSVHVCKFVWVAVCLSGTLMSGLITVQSLGLSLALPRIKHQIKPTAGQWDASHN